MPKRIKDKIAGLQLLNLSVFLALAASVFLNLSNCHHLASGWLNVFEIQLQSASL